MQHLVEDNAKTPNIALVGISLTGEDLWGSVEGSAEEAQFLCFGGVVDHSAEAEVAEFGNALFEEDVGRFDVSVYDVFFEEGGVADHEVAHEDECFTF